jgi:hypothetical protein
MRVYPNPHSAICAVGLTLIAAFGATYGFAQTAPAGSSAPQQPAQSSPAQRIEAPDGAPSVPKDVTINHTTSARDERTADVVSEEKIENRLAIIRSGRYFVTDPNVGRYDRAASNGVKRVSPSMWELFRF